MLDSCKFILIFLLVCVFAYPLHPLQLKSCVYAYIYIYIYTYDIYIYTYIYINIYTYDIYIYIYIYIYTIHTYIYVLVLLSEKKECSKKYSQSVTAHNNIIKTKNLMKALYPVILNGN